MTHDAQAPHERRAAPSLRAGVAALALGNGAFNVARIAFVAVLAKCADPAIVGEFNLALAISAPLVIALSLELRSVHVASVGERPTFGAYRALRLIGLVAAAAILAAVVVAHVIDRRNAALSFLVGATFASRLALYHADIYWGVYQKRERLDLLAWSNGLRGAAMIAPLALLALVVPRDSMGLAAGVAVAASAAAWVAITGLLDRRYALAQPGVALDWSRGDLAALLRRAMPLALCVCLVSLADNVPLLVVGAADKTRAALGYFGALALLPMAAQFVVVQIGSAASHRLAQSHRNDRRQFLRTLTRILAVTLAIIGGVLMFTALFGRWLLGAIYTAEYAAHFDAFWLIVVAQCVALPGSILGFVLTSAGRFWPQAAAQAIVLALTAGAAFWLIPGDPIGGAAWTMLLRGSVQTLLFAAITVRVFTEDGSRNVQA